MPAFNWTFAEIALYKEIKRRIKNDTYSKTKIDTKFNNVYNKSQIDTKFNNVYNKTDFAKIIVDSGTFDNELYSLYYDKYSDDSIYIYGLTKNIEVDLSATWGNEYYKRIVIQLPINLIEPNSIRFVNVQVKSLTGILKSTIVGITENTGVMTLYISDTVQATRNINLYIELKGVVNNDV